jgi:hypothetical protein
MIEAEFPGSLKFRAEGEVISIRPNGCPIVRLTNSTSAGTPIFFEPDGVSRAGFYRIVGGSEDV